MNKKRSGGFLGQIFSFLFVLFIIGGMVAFARHNNITDLDSLWAFAKQKSNDANECFDNGKGECMPELPGQPSDIIIKLPERLAGGLNLDGITLGSSTAGYRGPEFDEPYIVESGRLPKETSKLMLAEVRIEDPQDIKYSRKEWKHWASTPGRSCWDSRKDILYRDAVPGSIRMVDKKKNPTDDVNKACAVGIIEDGKVVSNDSGIWIDPYSNVKITDRGQVDIDHIIPLSYTARHGGQDWTPEKKAQYANDPSVLLATSAKENRTKGDKGPADYMPPYSAYSCAYAKQWVSVAYQYDISITTKDLSVLEKTLSKCGV